jgi:hypothetical protein
MFLTLSLYLQKYYEVDQPPKRYSIMCTGYIIKMAVTALSGFYFILLGFAQLYLGEMGYDQVILSYIVGAASGFIGHFALKLHFIRLNKYLNDGGQYSISALQLLGLTLGAFGVPMLACVSM